MRQMKVGLVLSLWSFFLAELVITTTLREFKFNNGLAVFPAVFPPNDFQEVQRISREICKKSLRKEKNSIAEGRLGHRIESSNELYEMFSNPNILSRIQKATGRTDSNLIIPQDFPLEIRKYVIGSHMPFHRDEQLYEQPQIEFVFTVENTSDSYTCWIDSKNNTQKLSTEPNSLICIQATTVNHSVTSLKKGERVIIKGVLVAQGEKKLNEKKFREALQTYSS